MACSPHLCLDALAVVDGSLREDDRIGEAASADALATGVTIEYFAQAKLLLVGQPHLRDFGW
ncbi:hypothetical protein GCM10010170_100700 [Dactylosporangium salmoneum]|uniref:Uncharacterized protein n=1 Tax=Dactylosporangium salmoneum TaxID=53361 RepID=A0ABN3HWU7_9ACTN